MAGYLGLGGHLLNVPAVVVGRGRQQGSGGDADEVRVVLSLTEGSVAAARAD